MARRVTCQSPFCYTNLLFALTVLLNMRAELVWNHREANWLQQMVRKV